MLSSPFSSLYCWKKSAAKSCHELFGRLGTVFCFFDTACGDFIVPARTEAEEEPFRSLSSVGMRLSSTLASFISFEGRPTRGLLRSFSKRLRSRICALRSASTRACSASLASAAICSGVLLLHTGHAYGISSSSPFCSLSNTSAATASHSR